LALLSVICSKTPHDVNLSRWVMASAKMRWPLADLTDVIPESCDKLTENGRLLR